MANFIESLGAVGSHFLLDVFTVMEERMKQADETAYRIVVDEKDQWQYRKKIAKAIMIGAASRRLALSIDQREWVSPTGRGCGE